MNLVESNRWYEFAQLARADPDTIELSMCDPPRFGFRPDPAILESITLKDIDQGYPPVNEDLVVGIRARTKSFTGVSVDGSDVVVTNGCGAAFGVLSIALNGWSIGIESPFYLPAYEYFRRTSQLWYARCKQDLSWSLDFDGLRKELEQKDQPGALFFVSPSNPTGHIHSKSDWQKIVDIAGEFNQIIITDEVYDEMSFVPFTSLLQVAKDVPVIYMHGFSKIWRAPEIRVGYLILHDPDEKVLELRHEIKSVANLGFGINPISQMMAVQLLKESSDYRKRQFDEIRDRRDALNKAIGKSSNLSSIEAEGATYQMIEAPWNDWEVCTKLLQDHRILVTPGSVHDSDIGDQFVRVVFLNTIENLLLFVECLDNHDG
ncbi:MAG: pyridoxal phosphate-dependent aminotransferase [Candidatus Thorarchaeota archaeon]|jgi:aspartate/methionine/tyrosine aminotransferase